MIIRFLIGIILAGCMVFGGLWIVSPAASTAVARARSAARYHRIAFPEPNPGWRFKDALIATEDHRFLSPFDPGIDPFAVLRVIYGKITGLIVYGRITGLPDLGGSTIEQQLAKMLYPSTRAGDFGTLKQIVLGIKLYFTYSRAEILSLYAETAYYGGGYYGLQAASEGYFGRSPQQLDWVRAAALAGIVNAPTLYDPRTHPVLCHRREVHVFHRLVAVGDLTAATARITMERPLDLVPTQSRT